MSLQIIGLPSNFVKMQQLLGVVETAKKYHVYFAADVRIEVVFATIRESFV